MLVPTVIFRRSISTAQSCPTTRPLAIPLPLSLPFSFHETGLLVWSEGPPFLLAHIRSDGEYMGMHEGLPGTKRGILFFVAICVVFMQAGLWAARRAAQESFPDNSLVPKPKLLSLVRKDPNAGIKEHPIPKLMAQAENNFRNLLSSQSKTLADAVAEYKRRYKRDPPLGFDEWWNFVQDNGVLMVDEYDAINEDLAPFWDITPVEFRLRASLVRAVLLCIHVV